MARCQRLKGEGSLTKFGVEVSAVMCSMEEVREAWRKVEDFGFDWISGQDHFYSLRSPDAACFEGLTCHAALAVASTRPRIGCLVYSSGYRHPAVMANALVTIDHLSNGRLELGIGAGWLEAEYRDYGILFEPPAVRLRRLKESVEIIRSLWTQEVTDYDGEFYQLHHARCDPKPMQSTPRIWIGAHQPKALKLAGEVGDAWNCDHQSPEDFARALAVVKEAAPNPDRFATGASMVFGGVGNKKDAEQIVRSQFGAAAEQMMPCALVGSVEEITERIGRYVEAGADWIILTARPPFNFDSLEQFATAVMPHFADEDARGSNPEPVQP
jgi:alkanesulfonate monooxygenase SsuD/methylene tetrahydromethanopterin reductase-like flavin-dependent oxidoreductase (luciferase family)